MAKIKLSAGYVNLQEGPKQLLRIRHSDFDESTMVASITFEDSDGATQKETYKLAKKVRDKKTRRVEMQPNQGALDAYSTVAICALQDGKVANKSIDPEELVGCYVVADVVSEPWKNPETGVERTYTHIRNFERAKGMSFGADDAETEEVAEEVAEEEEDDEGFDDLFDE